MRKLTKSYTKKTTKACRLCTRTNIYSMHILLKIFDRRFLQLGLMQSRIQTENGRENLITAQNKIDELDADIFATLVTDLTWAEMAAEPVAVDVDVESVSMRRR